MEDNKEAEKNQLPFYTGGFIPDNSSIPVIFDLFPGSYQLPGHINVSRAREFYINYKSTYGDNKQEVCDLVDHAAAINMLLPSGKYGRSLFQDMMECANCDDDKPYLYLDKDCISTMIRAHGNMFNINDQYNIINTDNYKENNELPKLEQNDITYTGAELIMQMYKNVDIDIDIEKAKSLITGYDHRNCVKCEEYENVSE